MLSRLTGPYGYISAAVVQMVASVHPALMPVNIVVTAAIVGMLVRDMRG
jgi:hypothetical protein